MSEPHPANLHLKCWNWEVFLNLVRHFIGEQPNQCIPPFLAHHYPRLRLKNLKKSVGDSKERIHNITTLGGFHRRDARFITLFVIHQRIEDSMASISDCPASLANSIGERLSGSLRL